MDTSLLGLPARLACAGARPTPVGRVALAILHAAAVAGGSEPKEMGKEGGKRDDIQRGKGGDKSWRGGMYVLPDDGPVLFIARGESEERVHALVTKRVESVTTCVLALFYFLLVYHIYLYLWANVVNTEYTVDLHTTMLYSRMRAS